MAGYVLKVCDAPDSQMCLYDVSGLSYGWMRLFDLSDTPDGQVCLFSSHALNGWLCAPACHVCLFAPIH